MPPRMPNASPLSSSPQLPGNATDASRDADRRRRKTHQTSRSRRRHTSSSSTSMPSPSLSTPATMNSTENMTTTAATPGSVSNNIPGDPAYNYGTLYNGVGGLNSLFNMGSAALYGGGMYGYGGGTYGNGMMNSSPAWSGLNQLLWNVQSLVVCTSQVVQVVTMNTSTIQALLDNVSAMVDHAIKSFAEVQALERAAARRNEETPADKARRRRLQTLRWALLMAGSWVAVKMIQRLLQGRRPRRRQWLSLSTSPKNHQFVPHGAA